MSNKGKEFEKDFQDSCDVQHIWVKRLHDTSLSWIEEKNAKFTPTNIADFLVFKTPFLFAIECKSTTYKSMSIQSEEDARKNKKKMIKYHQIKDLVEASMTDGLYAGFVLNFRDDLCVSNNAAYWMDISDFCEFLKNEGKKSINEDDCKKYGGVLLKQRLKRVRFAYNVEQMIEGAVARGKEIEKRVNDFLTNGINDLDSFFNDEEDDSADEEDDNS